MDPLDPKGELESAGPRIAASNSTAIDGVGQLPLLHRSATVPFAGRLGGQQSFIVSRDDPRNTKLLEKDPDAAPSIPLRQLVDLRPFRNVDLWKAATVEGVGTLLLVWITSYANASPAVIPTAPTAQWGNFDNAAFIGPLIGGIMNAVFLALFIFAFGAVSGAHFNPTITVATFFARLCSLPRMILYIAFQTAGAALAGLLFRASYGSRDFKVGGCWLYSDVVPVADAFVVEFMATSILLFVAFGVALDPRQGKVVGPTLAPIFVGLALGILTFASGFTRYGYGGASLNPARCFGVFVGSSFPSWHWIHWVADFVACIGHGILYFLVPPWHRSSGP